MPDNNCIILSDIDGTLLSDEQNYENSKERTLGMAKINYFSVSPETRELAGEINFFYGYDISSQFS